MGGEGAEGAVDARAEFFALGQERGRREEWRSRADKKNFITVRGRCVVTVIFFHFALGPTEFSYQVQGG